MKRVGNLITQIADYENLCLAYTKAKRGKTEKQEAMAYAKDLHNNLLLLQNQLLSAAVEVGNYRYFYIHDPKKRQICAAPFAERVLHHALMNVCHPIFDRYQISHSYATRPNKGTHLAVAQAQIFQRNYAYCLKMDIRKYFDSIDHAVLLGQLQRKFKDPFLLSIFAQIIRSYSAIPLHQAGSHAVGIPIGNLSSQYFANHYLAALDHLLKDHLRLPAYVRYMDDFVLWHNNAGELRQIGQYIRTYLTNTLRLTLKTCQQTANTSGLSFLGYRIFPYQIKLHSRSKKRYLKKMTILTQLLQNEQISQAQFQQRGNSLYNFIRYADTKHFLKKNWILHHSTT